MTAYSPVLKFNPPLPYFSPFIKLGHFKHLNLSNHSIFKNLSSSSPITSPGLITAASSTRMEQQQQSGTSEYEAMTKLLFVEMGVGYDQHGQDITKAAIKACKDAITSNSIPAFRTGSIPGVTFEEMKLQIKLGVPHSLQQSLDIERVKAVFPYGKIVKFEVVDGGLICSSGVHVEEMGDTSDDCYVVNAAVYVGY